MTVAVNASIQVKETKDWSKFVTALRTVTLLGDRSVLPYQDAQISTRVILPHEVEPISKYVITSHLETQQRLRELLLIEQDIDLLDLRDNHTHVGFTVSGESGEWYMSPPIVEFSVADQKPVLLDGEHRFFMAQQLQLPIRVVWIEQVPDQVPVVGKPIPWKEVKQYDVVPDVSQKRSYRFPTLSEFPDISSFSAVHVTPENYLYFFYRDLSPVCTSAVRKTGTS